MYVKAVVEGPVDEAVASVLVRTTGSDVGEVHGNRGKAAIAQRIAGYNHAAATTGMPWVVLVDLDRDAPCAVPLRNAWLPEVAPSLCFRIAVRAVEAWLLADRQRVSTFFRVRQGIVPDEPEALLDPKRALVDLCRESRHKAVREAMVPRPASGRSVGPGYTNMVRDFILDRDRGWRPAVAAEKADSLRRAMQCIARISSGR